MENQLEMEGSEALKMYVLPFPSPGHTIPLINLAQILALKGHHITILTTPSNAQVLPNNLNVHTFDFPSDQVGLPSGLENAASAGDSVTAHKILKAALLLKPQIETLVQQNPPHVLISDFMFRWSSKLGVPTLLFTPMPIFVDCVF
ncbi:UDP-glycosyltransferase 73B5-like [Glycine max]|nr:UDP-glycosyltransferase 73B5-like [Glycine max]|eukprot:XP_014634977.1 UDP-glycosyltransferase 73B5-like [Glycine max]